MRENVRENLRALIRNGSRTHGFLLGLLSIPNAAAPQAYDKRLYLRLQHCGYPHGIQIRYDVPAVLSSSLSSTP